MVNIMGLKVVIFIALQLVILRGISYSADNGSEFKVLLHSEYCSYNIVYVSKDPGNPLTFFSVPMTNIGTELHYRGKEIYTYGFGCVRTEIFEGREYNKDYNEIQSWTEIVLPYYFIGNDYGLFALEIGMGYYLTFMKSSGRYYYQPDGSLIKAEQGGTYLDRDDSYVLVNFMLRMLREDSYHLKVKFARERFHIIESLLQIAFIYPYKNHEGEIYFSWPTDFSSYFPVSNQRLGICYSYSVRPFKFGITAGYSVANKRGGGGDGIWIGIFDPNNFSIGLNIEAAW